MKHYLLGLALLSSTFWANAAEPVVRYSILAGSELVWSRGDLDGKRSVKAVGEEVVSEDIYLADIPSFVTYGFDLRAHVDASSVSFNLGLGYPEAQYNGIQEQARLFRLGVEYQYHFRWPEAVRPGIGLGYDFMSVRVPNASLSEGERSWATHSGSGFHGTLSLGYYGWQHFGIEAASRYRLIGLGNVSTSANDFSELSTTLWQGFGELGLRGIVTF